MSGTPNPTPQEFAAEIAASRRAQVPYIDPMRVGIGTPWEDRGSKGAISAFVQTCVLSTFRPTRLYHALRRPETYVDARSFALTCLSFWGLFWVANTALIYFFAVHTVDQDHQPLYDVVNGQAYVIGTVLQFVAAVVGGFFLLQLASRILHQLVIGETRAKFRPVLTLNVASYALGPSVLLALAAVPWLGLGARVFLGNSVVYPWLPLYYHYFMWLIPAVVAVWILASAVIGTTVRLRLRTFGAVICTVLALLAVVVVAVVAYFAGWLLWCKILGMQGIEDAHPVNTVPSTQQTVETLE
jgi:hypothetical protein